MCACRKMTKCFAGYMISGMGNSFLSKGIPDLLSFSTFVDTPLGWSRPEFELQLVPKGPHILNKPMKYGGGGVYSQLLVVPVGPEFYEISYFNKVLKSNLDRYCITYFIYYISTTGKILWKSYIQNWMWQVVTGVRRK